MKKSIITLVIAGTSLFLMNCKKKPVDAHVPPNVTYKTGGKFISDNCTLPKQDTVMVGMTATKTEDNLKSYNVSYAYDGASTTTTFFNYYLAEAEYNGYSKDVTIITRNQAGSERWVFSVVDRDGNITQKTIVITVQ